MSESATAKLARQEIRDRERAVWQNVEKIGRDARQTDGLRQSMTQADADGAKRKPERQNET